ncbi:metal ABC transporter ATP-binding protein [Staphylococcus warneri]|uniref:metal ABC transporter ATP-binding protein n=1 Tax=Staphylococcus warneri TaxID=1292 RepID=UPI003D768584
MLEVSNLNLFLGNKHILKDIDFKIPIAGEMIGIMGPNGAGKSSLLKSLIGDFQATGTQLLYQRPIHTQLKYMTYIPQKSNIDLDFPINVEKVILSGCYGDIGWFSKPKHETKIQLNQLLDDLDLKSLKRKQISALSGGQLQRVLVARALMSKSKLYLFDEPFVGIDFKSEQLIMNKIRQLKAQGKLILIVHHDLTKASQYFDRIMLLNQTLRYFGNAEEAMNSDTLLNDTFMSQNSHIDVSSKGSA